MKCAGAPQKITYLCDDFWKKNNIKAEVHFFTPLPQMFGVQYYSDSLEKIVKEKGITPHYNNILVSVKNGVATLKDTTTNNTFEEQFDFLHAVPNLGVPDFLKSSKLCNEAGFVEVGRNLRHKKYQNIWAIGDCISLPNSKTAAAIFMQAPILVYHLSNSIKSRQSNPVVYDGYTSCPIYMTKGTLLLAEFKEYPDKDGKIIREVDESFQKGGQNRPSILYYYITVSLTYFYKLGLEGKWFGKYSLFRPNYEKEKTAEWVRSLYLPVLYSGGFLLVFGVIYSINLLLIN